MGVKGRSVLHLLRLPEFDVIKGCPVDYMHCVFLGVTRKLLSLWFDPKHHHNEWYVNYCFIVINTIYYSCFDVGTLVVGAKLHK